MKLWEFVLWGAVILFFGYLACRLWSFAVFRSYFQVRRERDERKD